MKSEAIAAATKIPLRNCFNTFTIFNFNVFIIIFNIEQKGYTHQIYRMTDFLRFKQELKSTSLTACTFTALAKTRKS